MPFIRISFNIIWKKIFVMNFPFLTDSLKCPTPSKVKIRYTWKKLFVDDALIFDPAPICTEKSLNWVKSNYGFYWKFKGDRASILIRLGGLMAIFDFCHLQGVNCGQSWTKNSNFGYTLSVKIRVKTRVFQNALKIICTILRTNCGQMISSIWRSLIEVLPPNPAKCAQLVLN